MGWDNDVSEGDTWRERRSTLLGWRGTLHHKEQRDQDDAIWSSHIGLAMLHLEYFAANLVRV